MVSLTNFRSVGDWDEEQRGHVRAPTSNQRQQQQPPQYRDQVPIIEQQQPAADLKAKSNLFHPQAIQHEMLQQAAGGNFEISWTNLTYQVEPKWYHQLHWTRTADKSQATSSSGGGGGRQSAASEPAKKSILNNLNGCVKSGQVTAILGPSGAGKTSLLGCLTGKNKSGVTGSVQVRSHSQKPLSICTIPQKDFLLNQLTVRENLWFASRLKHPTDHFDHESNIERVLELLKLESCIDTKISKISGGQYKRVSIAQELLSSPDILILDEPTSGLDSLTCYKTVLVLRDLAQLSPNPMAILVTIHQPQREVFDLFNHVYILAVGGRCIYEGHPSLAVRTINQSSGGLHFDADQYNPASYLVEIASTEFGEKPIESLAEHQKREFRRRQAQQQEQDQLLALQAAGAMQAANGGSGGLDCSAGLLTPNLKKRQSPMVARFRSTLTNLIGSTNSSPQLGANRQQQQQQQQLQLPSYQQSTDGATFAYTNAAYDGHPTEQLDARALGSTPKANQLHLNHHLDHQPQADQLVAAANDDHDHDHDAFYLDERLQTHKHDHKGHFFRHCQLLTKRSWLCLCKDPMLTTLRFSAHILVPLLITLVYGSRVGKSNACPIYESEMDLIDYARHGAKRLLNLQTELRSTFENVGLYFLSIYAFTFSTMCLTSLSFPLNMHVLLKEVRNGWYSIPTYFIGKTLADFPLEFILPTVTLMITYPLTGQPSSYLEWRFILATTIFVITSLIAQTQGLIFGALFMNAMQAAVFVAPVSTTPLILLSGFLIRISQMPAYLQNLSCLSYFRYAIESLTIIRYGFGQCPCDPDQVTGRPVSPSGVPDQLRTMTNYWLSTFDSAPASADEDIGIADAAANGTAIGLAANGTSADGAQVDFFQDLTELLSRANSFGADIKTCDDLKPYPMIDFHLEDRQLYVWVAALVATLVVSKIVNYIVVKYSVKWRI